MIPSRFEPEKGTPVWVFEILFGAIGLWLVKLPFRIVSGVSRRDRALRDEWCLESVIGLWQSYDLERPEFDGGSLTRIP